MKRDEEKQLFFKMSLRNHAGFIYVTAQPVLVGNTGFFFFFFLKRGGSHNKIKQSKTRKMAVAALFKILTMFLCNTDCF